jgi:hypothetical protein
LPQVQEVEEVREAHKAAVSVQMAVIAEMAQNAQSGGKKNSYWEDVLALKKNTTCSRICTKEHVKVTTSHDLFSTCP